MEMNIMGKMVPINIVGTAKAKNPPQGAMFCTMNPTGEFIELFYKTSPVKFNDGTESEKLEYWSNFDCWRGSNERDIEEFLQTRKFYKL